MMELMWMVMRGQCGLMLNEKEGRNIPFPPPPAHMRVASLPCVWAWGLNTTSSPSNLPHLFARGMKGGSVVGIK